MPQHEPGQHLGGIHRIHWRQLALLARAGGRGHADSRRDHPAAGDTNGQPDVLLVGVATGTERPAELAPHGPSSPVPHRFTADGQRLVVELQDNGPVGVAGRYATTLATGGSQLLMPSGTVNPPRAYSVDDTAARVALLRRADRSATNVNGNGNTATLAIAGKVRHVALGSSSTHLVPRPRHSACSNSGKDSAPTAGGAWNGRERGKAKRQTVAAGARQ